MSDTQRLAGKAAVVTGASRGIGRAIALRLARDGASVVVNYVRGAEAARTLVDEIVASGGQAVALAADMSKPSDVQALCASAEDRFGGWDILVNNAGDATFAPVAEVAEAEFDRLFQINVKGPFIAMQEAAKKLRDGGRIVNISSGITIVGTAGGGVYAATKAALEQITVSLSKEIANRGITVNCVSPGMTVTDLLNSLVPTEAHAEMAKSIPLGRMGSPDDIADVVAFLCSNDGRWITGQNIRATGGAN